MSKQFFFTEMEIQYLLESVEMDIGSGKIPQEYKIPALSVLDKLSAK